MFVDFTAAPRKRSAWPCYLALAICLVALRLPGQQRQASFLEVGLDQGLPECVVLSVLQDPDGLVWFGTDKGVMRFDGHRVSRFLPDSGINFVHALHLDRAGRIWIGTRRGLFYYHEGELQTVPIPRRADDKQPTDFVTNFAGDPETGFWIGTHVGLYRCTPDLELKRIILDERKGYRQASDVVLDVALDRSGACLCGTGAGLYRVDGDSKPAYVFSPRSLDSKVRSFRIDDIHVRKDGVCFLSGAVDVYVWEEDGAAVTYLTDRSGRRIVGGTGLAEDARGRLWMSTIENGLAVIEPGDLVADFLEIYDLPVVDNPLVKVHLTPDGTLWTSLRNSVRFANVSADFRWLTPAKIAGGVQPAVQDAARDPSGRLWLATREMGLQVIPPVGPSISCFSDGRKEFRFEHRNVAHVASDSQGAVAVAPRRGGLHLWRAGVGFVELQLPTAQQTAPVIRAMMCRGEEFIIATESEVFFGPVDNLVRVGSALSGSVIVGASVGSLPDGRVFFGTTRGLFVADGEGGFIYCGREGQELTDIVLPADIVKTACAVDDNVILMSAGNDLYEIDVSARSSRKVRLEDEDGYDATTVMTSMETDARGTVWAIANGTLNFIDPVRRIVRTLRSNRGIQVGMVDRVASLGPEAGDLFVAGATGVTVFDPAESGRRSPAPKVRLMEMKVEGRSASDSDEALRTRRVQLETGRSGVRFRLAAFHFLDPALNKIKIKLVGGGSEDAAWQEISSNGEVFFFAELPAGEYEFHAKAVSGDGVSSEPRRVFSLAIVPPFWNRPIFRWSVASALVLLSLGALILRLRATRIRAQELEVLVRERTRSLKARTEDLQAVHGVLKAINSAPDVERLTAFSLERIVEDMEALGGYFLLHDRSERTYNCSAVSGLVDPPAEQLDHEQVRARFERSGKEVEPGIFLHAADVPRTVMKLSDEEGIIGYLVIERSAGGPTFDEGSVGMLRRIREPIALALKRRQLLDVLSELNEKKTEILGAAAHDLRSPLSAMSLTAENLLSKDPERAVEGLKQDVGRILKTITRMSDLVNKLLNVAAIDSGKIDLELSELSLTELLSERVEAARGSAETKGISLVFEGREIGPLEADRERLAAAIDNLVSNAIKYTHPGGEVEVSLEAVDDHCEISVRDTGQGLPPEDVADLFKTFRRMSAKPTGGEVATGFGLAIVKNVVELHGGEARAHSRVGVGSTFTISLPLAG